MAVCRRGSIPNLIFGGAARTREVDRYLCNLLTEQARSCKLCRFARAALLADLLAKVAAAFGRGCSARQQSSSLAASVSTTRNAISRQQQHLPAHLPPPIPPPTLHRRHQYQQAPQIVAVICRHSRVVWADSLPQFRLVAKVSSPIIPTS